MKAKFLALAALVLGLASCQTEPEGLDVVLGGEQEVTINVSLPGVTRGSADSGIVNVDFDVYDVRYVLEVYDVATEPAQLASRDVKTTDDTSTAFDVRLVPDRDYKFVVWADIVANGSKDDNHYTTTHGLTNITLNGEWNAMDETRDAYTDVVEIKDYNSGSTIEMTLVRPFGKLRAVTTDIDALEALQNNALPKSVNVIYSVGALSEFNALTETASKPVAKTFTYDLTDVYGESGNELTLFSDYLFGTASGTMQFAMNVTLENGNVVSNTFNTEIPVERNKVTTIIGDLLTDANNVKVEIEDGFEQPENTITVVESASDLQEAIQNAKDNEETHITLGDDINLGGMTILSTRAAVELPDHCITIPANKTIVIDLNGKTLSAPLQSGSQTNHMYAFGVYGSLTINDSVGEGKIVARGNYNAGTFILNSGTIVACDDNGGYGVRNYEGKFIMNGGSIIAPKENGDTPGNGYDASTLRVDEGATATIKGGVINNISNYTFAIDNYGTVNVEGGEFTSIHTTIWNEGEMTINGGKFTCNGLEGITAHVLVAEDGSETTINGGTFDGKDNYNGFNVDAVAGAVVNIYGGNFLSVHSGSLYGNGTINVMGGKFFDNPSARVAEGYKAVEENGVWTVSEDVAHVTTAAELKAAAEAGAYKIVFDADIEASEIIVFQNSTIIEGNGKTLKSTAGRAINVSGADGITIQNLTINASGERAINIIQNSTNVTIDHVTATAANYTVNVASSAPNAVVAIKNSTLNGLCTVNVAAAGAYVTVADSTVNCNDNNTTAGESYAALVLLKDAVGGQIIATNSTINVTEGSDSYQGRNQAEDGVVTINDSDANVSINRAVITYVGSDYYYGFQTLAEAVEFAKNGDVITLIRDIELTETIIISGKDITIDLNNKTVTATGVDAFKAEADAKLTLKNGNVTSHGAIVRAIAGEVVIESGNYTQTGTAVGSEPATYRYAIDAREGGKITINGGEFTSGNGMFNVDSEIVINGGKFTNIVEKSMTRHFAYVSAKLTINGGEFYGKANGSAGGCFFCGAASGGDIQIHGGKFTSLWTSGAVNRIFEVYYGGTINVTGGMFNTNGGIATFVTENTDDATKVAYPYIAK